MILLAERRGRRSEISPPRGILRSKSKGTAGLSPDIEQPCFIEMDSINKHCHIEMFCSIDAPCPIEMLCFYAEAPELRLAQTHSCTSKTNSNPLIKRRPYLTH